MLQDSVGFMPVETWTDANWLRKIRNDCRKFMTHDQSKIGLLRQLWWFNRTYLPAYFKGTLTAYLIFDLANTQNPVGYGIVRKFNNPSSPGLKKWWVSGGLVESYRGKGYGRELFTFLTNEASKRSGNGQVWLDVQRTNTPAVALYRKLGYKRMPHLLRGVDVYRRPQ